MDNAPAENEIPAGSRRRRRSEDIGRGNRKRSPRRSLSLVTVDESSETSFVVLGSPYPPPRDSPLTLLQRAQHALQDGSVSGAHRLHTSFGTSLTDTSGSSASESSFQPQFKNAAAQIIRERMKARRTNYPTRMFPRLVLPSPIPTQSPASSGDSSFLRKLPSPNASARRENFSGASLELPSPRQSSLREFSQDSRRSLQVVSPSKSQRVRIDLSDAPLDLQSPATQGTSRPSQQRTSSLGAVSPVSEKFADEQLDSLSIRSPHSASSGNQRTELQLVSPRNSADIHGSGETAVSRSSAIPSPRLSEPSQSPEEQRSSIISQGSSAAEEDRVSEEEQENSASPDVSPKASLANSEENEEETSRNATNGSLGLDQSRPSRVSGFSSRSTPGSRKSFQAERSKGREMEDYSLVSDDDDNVEGEPDQEKEEFQPENVLEQSDQEGFNSEVGETHDSGGRQPLDSLGSISDMRRRATTFGIDSSLPLPPISLLSFPRPSEYVPLEEEWSNGPRDEATSSRFDRRRSTVPNRPQDVGSHQRRHTVAGNLKASRVTLTANSSYRVVTPKSFSHASKIQPDGDPQDSQHTTIATSPIGFPESPELVVPPLSRKFVDIGLSPIPQTLDPRNSDIRHTAPRASSTPIPDDSPSHRPGSGRSYHGGRQSSDIRNYVSADPPGHRSPRRSSNGRDRPGTTEVGHTAPRESSGSSSSTSTSRQELTPRRSVMSAGRRHSQQASLDTPPIVPSQTRDRYPLDRPLATPRSPGSGSNRTSEVDSRPPRASSVHESLENGTPGPLSGTQRPSARTLGSPSRNRSVDNRVGNDQSTGDEEVQQPPGRDFHLQAEGRSRQSSRFTSFYNGVSSLFRGYDSVSSSPASEGAISRRSTGFPLADYQLADPIPRRSPVEPIPRRSSISGEGTPRKSVRFSEPPPASWISPEASKRSRRLSGTADGIIGSPRLSLSRTPVPAKVPSSANALEPRGSQPRSPGRTSVFSAASPSASSLAPPGYARRSEVSVVVPEGLPRVRRDTLMPTPPPSQMPQPIPDPPRRPNKSMAAQRTPEDALNAALPRAPRSDPFPKRPNRHAGDGLPALPRPSAVNPTVGDLSRTVQDSTSSGKKRSTIGRSAEENLALEDHENDRTDKAPRTLMRKSPGSTRTSAHRDARDPTSFGQRDRTRRSAEENEVPEEDNQPTPESSRTSGVFSNSDRTSSPKDATRDSSNRGKRRISAHGSVGVNETSEQSTQPASKSPRISTGRSPKSNRTSLQKDRAPTQEFDDPSLNPNDLTHTDDDESPEQTLQTARRKTGGNTPGRYSGNSSTAESGTNEISPYQALNGSGGSGDSQINASGGSLELSTGYQFLSRKGFPPVPQWHCHVGLFITLVMDAMEVVKKKKGDVTWKDLRLITSQVSMRVVSPSKEQKSENELMLEQDLRTATYKWGDMHRLLMRFMTKRECPFEYYLKIAELIPFPQLVRKLYPSPGRAG